MTTKETTILFAYVWSISNILNALRQYANEMKWNGMELYEELTTLITNVKQIPLKYVANALEIFATIRIVQ